MADHDAAFEAAVQEQLAAMRRYLNVHGEMPPPSATDERRTQAHTHTADTDTYGQHSADAAWSSALPRQADAEARSHRTEPSWAAAPGRSAFGGDQERAWRDAKPGFPTHVRAVDPILPQEVDVPISVSSLGNPRSSAPWAALAPPSVFAAGDRPAAASAPADKPPLPPSHGFPAHAHPRAVDGEVVVSARAGRRARNEPDLVSLAAERSVHTGHARDVGRAEGAGAVGEVGGIIPAGTGTEDGRAAARARQAAYAAELARQIQEREEQRKRDRPSSPASAAVGVWPPEPSEQRGGRRRSTAANAAGQLPPRAGGDAHYSPPNAAMLSRDSDAPQAMPMARRPSRYRDMSVDLIAAVESTPANFAQAPAQPVEHARVSLPPHSAALASVGGGVEMPGNMDADAISKAVQAGHTFSRYRFDRLPAEEQARVLAAHRAKEAQAAELAAQIEERRAAKDREARDAAERARMEEEQFAKEREELLRRQQAEMMADRSVIPAATTRARPAEGSPRALGNSDAAAHTLHTNAGDADGPGSVSGRQYATTRDRVLALRQARMQREGGLGGDSALEPPPSDMRSRQPAATEKDSQAPQVHTHEFAGSLSPAALRDTAVSSISAHQPSMANADYDTRVGVPSFAAAGQTAPMLYADAIGRVHSPTWEPAPALAAGPSWPQRPGAPGSDGLTTFAEGDVSQGLAEFRRRGADWSLLPEAFIHRMRYALAELEAAAAAVPLVRANARSGARNTHAVGRYDSALAALDDVDARPLDVEHPDELRRYGPDRTVEPSMVSSGHSIPTGDALPWMAAESAAQPPATDYQQSSADLSQLSRSMLPSGSHQVDLTWVGADRPRTVAPSEVRASHVARGFLRGKWAQSFEQSVAQTSAPALQEASGPAMPFADDSAKSERAPLPLVEQSLDSSTLLVYLDGARAEGAARADPTRPMSALRVVDEGDEAADDDPATTFQKSSESVGLDATSQSAADQQTGPHAAISRASAHDGPAQQDDASVLAQPLSAVSAVLGAGVQDNDRPSPAYPPTSVPRAALAASPTAEQYEEDGFEEDDDDTPPQPSPGTQVQSSEHDDDGHTEHTALPSPGTQRQGTDTTASTPTLWSHNFGVPFITSERSPAFASKPPSPHGAVPDASADAARKSPNELQHGESGVSVSSRPDSSLHRQLIAHSNGPAAVASPRAISFAEIQAALDGVALGAGNDDQVKPSSVDSVAAGPQHIAQVVTDDVKHSAELHPPFNADAAANSASVGVHGSAPSIAPLAAGTDHPSHQDRAPSAKLAASQTGSSFAVDSTADLSTLDSTGKYARRHSWGLSEPDVELHKRRLLAFYTLHAPAKAHKENVDHAWQLFGPRIWEELERKYKGKTVGFRPLPRDAGTKDASPLDTGKVDELA